MTNGYIGSVFYCGSFCNKKSTTKYIQSELSGSRKILQVGSYFVCVCVCASTSDRTSDWTMFIAFDAWEFIIYEKLLLRFNSWFYVRSRFMEDGQAIAQDIKHWLSCKLRVVRRYCLPVHSLAIIWPKDESENFLHTNRIELEIFIFIL